MADLLFSRKQVEESKKEKPLRGIGEIELSDGTIVDFDVDIDTTDALNMAAWGKELEKMDGNRPPEFYDFCRYDYLKLPESYTTTNQAVFDTSMYVVNLYNELNGIKPDGTKMNREEQRAKRFQR